MKGIKHYLIKSSLTYKYVTCLCQETGVSKIHPRVRRQTLHLEGHLASASKELCQPPSQCAVLLLVTLWIPLFIKRLCILWGGLCIISILITKFWLFSNVNMLYKPDIILWTNIKVIFCTLLPDMFTYLYDDCITALSEAISRLATHRIYFYWICAFCVTYHQDSCQPGDTSVIYMRDSSSSESCQ